jgi:hypothetical protein
MLASRSRSSSNMTTTPIKKSSKEKITPQKERFPKLGIYVMYI